MLNKKLYFPKQTKLAKRVALFYKFANLFNCGLIEGSWILSATVFDPLQNVILGEVYKENPGLHRQVLIKERVF